MYFVNLSLRHDVLGNLLAVEPKYIDMFELY